MSNGSVALLTSQYILFFVISAVFGQNDMSELINDYQLDLLRALEMSRLQFLREIGSLRPGIGDRLRFSLFAITSYN